MSGKNLVIVESPAKASTIEKFLGSDYKVLSSYGHVRDLPKEEIGIEIESDFAPKYVVSTDKKKTVTALKKAVKEVDTVWLATDEDREGEAIAWHLFETLNLKNKATHRIVFHEITETAILNAIKNPRTIDISIVDAQQARRILDRLVGYKLSPVLWRKVRTGLSAGRVQSVAVRIIVEREREVENFEHSSNYKVTGQFIVKDDVLLNAQIKKRFKTEKELNDFLEKIKHADYSIKDIVKKPGIRRPSPPFTTSTLQQEADRKLGFSSKQTMMLAQRLYEAGKITYMRTDSLNLSDLAIGQAKDTIISNYGENYSQTRVYKTKTAGAQEAHEAIRPTDFNVPSTGADKNQTRLYELIWKRAIASQMADAKLEKTNVQVGISKAEEIFEASCEIIIFDGFIKVYMASSFDDENGDDENSKLLPPLTVGQELISDTINGREVYKKMPTRYSEAGLVKKMEEMGIGRPSTYAPTISTIQDREYIEKGNLEPQERKYVELILKDNEIQKLEKLENYGAEKAKLLPTDMGKVVNDFLVKYFSDVVDFHFTAKVEEDFDKIANGKKQWNEMIAEFYSPFAQTIEDTKDISRSEATNTRNLGNDPKTGKPIFAKIGRYGPMFQLGDNEEEEEKPKFAAIPKTKKFDKVTLEDALPLFDLPRHVGDSPDGYKVVTQIGRFGPYIRCNKTFVSIKEEEIFTLNIEEAMTRVNDKNEEKAKNTFQVFEEEGIQVLNGRYGPYITNGSKNVKIPKDTDPLTLTLEQCKEMIENAPEKKSRRKAASKKTAKTTKTAKEKTTKAKATKTTKAKVVKKTTKAKTTKATKKKTTD